MNKRTKKQKKIKDSWLKGLAYHKDLALSVNLSRHRLDGWSERKVRGVWDKLYNISQSWKNKHGIQQRFKSDFLNTGFYGTEGIPEGHEILIPLEQSEPWHCGGYGISDSFDLYIFLRDTEYIELKPLLEKYGDFNLLAVIVLKEASLPYPSSSGSGAHILAAIKAEREMTVNYYAYIARNTMRLAKHLDISIKQKKELLDAGRVLGSLANKEKAAKRHHAICESASYYFKKNPGSNYDKCIDWILNDISPNLQNCVKYNGKKLSPSRIKKIIAGAKEQALKSLSS